MKQAILFAASACSCMAAIGNFRVLGTTATQALIAYTAPDGNACTIQLKPERLVYAAGPGRGSGYVRQFQFRSDPAQHGYERPCPHGSARPAHGAVATAGTHAGVRHFSRALQAYTPYFGQITCPSTGDTADFTFTTGNIPLGIAYGDPWLSDAAHPGDQPWPESTPPPPLSACWTFVCRSTAAFRAPVRCNR
jgi:hypothetical protein